MSTGYVKQRDGLKGGRGVILSNSNKGRALGPSRLKKGGAGCVLKIKSLSVYLSILAVSPIFCAFYLFTSYTGIWIYGAAHAGGPNVAIVASSGYYPVIKSTRWPNSCRGLFTNIRGTEDRE